MTRKAMQQIPRRVYEKLGYNMWKTQGSNGEQHYISAHLNPLRDTVDLSIVDPLDRPYLLMCSCRRFTIGIPADCGNPFDIPCKHVQEFDEKEVSVEELERHS